MLNLENIYLFLYALPLYQLIFYTIQLATLKKTNPSRYFMGLLLLNLTAVLGLNAVFHLGLSKLFFAFYAIFTPLILLILPSFFLYVYSFVTSFSTTRVSRFLMLSPSIILLIVNLFLTISEKDFNLFLFEPITEVYEAGILKFATILLLRFILPIVLLTQITLAFIKVYRIIETEKAHMVCYPGSSKIIGFNWIYLIFASIVISIAVVLLPFIFSLKEVMYYPLVSNLLLLISTGLIGYYGLTKNKLLYISDMLLEERQSNSTGKESISVITETIIAEKDNEELFHKHSKSAENGHQLICAEEAAEIIKQLYELMEEKKPYLDPTYSMDDLCDQMKTDRRKVSYVLNNELKVNFYGIINEFRMKDAIHYIENDGQKFTIDAIAQMVGFNSKSSFYTCFKKHTGHTPKEYLSKKELT
jgi:AraC-like DNA-binding protein